MIRLMYLSLFSACFIHQCVELLLVLYPSEFLTKLQLWSASLWFLSLIIFIIVTTYRDYPWLKIYFLRFIHPRRGVVKKEDEKRVVGRRQEGKTNVTIHLADVLDLIEKKNGCKCQTVEGEEREVSYIDRECRVCCKEIDPTERRVFHNSGSECYICYRQRLDKAFVIRLFLIEEMEVEVKEIRGFISQIYFSLYEEKLTLLPAETSLFIPSEFHALFHSFPTLPIPFFYKEEGRMTFPIYNQHTNLQHLFDLYFKEQPLRIVHRSTLLRGIDQFLTAYEVSSLVKALKCLHRERESIMTNKLSS